MFFRLADLAMVEAQTRGVRVSSDNLCQSGDIRLTSIRVLSLYNDNAVWNSYLALSFLILFLVFNLILSFLTHNHPILHLFPHPWHVMNMDAGSSHDLVCSSM
jgi:hypothetical protein